MALERRGRDLPARTATSRSSVPDSLPVLQLIVVSAVEILQGMAGVIALRQSDSEGRETLIPRASYGLPEGALSSLHPHLDRTILGALGQLNEQVSLLYVPTAGLGDWAYRYHVLALPMQRDDRLLGVIYVFRLPTTEGFSARDLQVLDVFARQAAGALDQAQATADMLAEKTRLEELQNTFVSIVSHELQTPVAIIKSYAATLSREDAHWPAETVQRVSRNVEEECDRLHRLITDLLDLSRIQAGTVALRPTNVDLAALAREVVDQLGPRAPRHSLRTSFPAYFPTVVGDADQLRRALYNLVQNAVKYSPQGGEVLVVGETLRQPPSILLRVVDQGVGIAVGDERRIFERFYRTDTRLSRSTSGVGLGLYITRSIVEAHGGRITAESAGPGRGSVFTITLPLDRHSETTANAS